MFAKCGEHGKEMSLFCSAGSVFRLGEQSQLKLCLDSRFAHSREYNLMVVSQLLPKYLHSELIYAIDVLGMEVNPFYSPEHQGQSKQDTSVQQ